MSNLIKAYSIKYNENEKRTIDTNQAAEERVRTYLSMLKEQNPLAVSENETAPAQQGEGFVAGLLAATVEEIPEQEEDSTDKMQEAIEQQLEASRLQLENTQREASIIIDQAKEEVRIMLNSAEHEASVRAKEILDRAEKDGYEQGMKKAEQEIALAKQQVEEEKVKLIGEYERKVKEFEPVFADLLISFIKRFTGVIVDDKRDIVLYLLEQELLNIENSSTYLIRVSKDDYEMVNSKKNEIAWKLKEGTEVEIIEDRMLSRAQCMIETDSRIIDCSLDVQLKNLISDLKLLVGPRDNSNSSQEL